MEKKISDKRPKASLINFRDSSAAITRRNQTKRGVKI
jgi:hypothetical protein